MIPRRCFRYLINRAWIATYASECARFQGALGRVAEVQERYLLNLLKRNAETRFGRQHRLSSIRSVQQFQETVPVTSFEDLRDFIAAISQGDSNILTHERVKLFQPTSGSQSAAKLIPWTSSLQHEFLRGIAPWLAALYQRKPAIMSGSTYWSVSPPVSRVRSSGTLPIGFDHDAEYLGFLGKSLFSLTSAVSPEVAQCQDVNQFKIQTLVSLLTEEELGFVSVWSPTFLTVLLEYFLSQREGILDALCTSGKADAVKRAASIRFIFKENKGSTIFEHIWPKLQVISCWTHGSSEIYAQGLRRYFPTVEIQGKGLVATEAFVSLPFQDGQDPVLAVNSHFFEFCDSISGETHLAHELVQGRTYSVIVTTGGGLYRYRLGDLVEVTGFLRQAPCLRFVGREGNVADLFGEKLHGAAVEAGIRKTLSAMNITARFFLLAPVTRPEAIAAYTLFLDTDSPVDAEALGEVLDKELGENFHYSHCRRLGQLAAPRIFKINRIGKLPEDIFLKEMHRRGLQLGTIKMVSLDAQTGWDQLFAGQFLD